MKILFADFKINCVPQGVGRVRVEPHPNVTVDVFVTHTCAEDYNYWCVQGHLWKYDISHSSPIILIT